jgi:hypothetical protein
MEVACHLEKGGIIILELKKSLGNVASFDFNRRILRENCKKGLE